MKRFTLFAMLAVIWVLCVYDVSANTVTYPVSSGRPGRITVVATQDLNDLSLTTWAVTGTLERIAILAPPSDANHSETDFTVTLKDDLGLTLFTRTDCNSLVMPYNYALTSADKAANLYPGIAVSGPLTLEIEDVNSSAEIQTLSPDAAATAGPFWLTYDGQSTVHVSEVVTLTDVNDPNGGTFKLTFGGQETAALAYDVNSVVLDAALEALTSIGADEVVCSGGPLPDVPMVITFDEGLGYQNVGAITLTTNALTATTTGKTASYLITVTTAGDGLIYSSSIAGIQAALEAMSNVDANDIIVGGGPLSEDANDTTFTFLLENGDVPIIAIDSTYLTGPTICPIHETVKGGFDLPQITVDIYYKPQN